MAGYSKGDRILTYIYHDSDDIPPTSGNENGVPWTARIRSDGKDLRPKSHWVAVSVV